MASGDAADSGGRTGARLGMRRDSRCRHLASRRPMARRGEGDAMIRFFDLLAIDRTLSLPQQLAAAAAKWPNEEVQPFTGDAFGNTDDYLSLLEYLQDVLFFKAV